MSDVRPDPTRRALVTGICGSACAAAFTACGGGNRSAAPPAASPVPGPGAPAAPTAPGGTASELTALSGIPVGGGRIFPDLRLVVTRPTAGDLRAFTAICTHDGCTLTAVADATINCPCHGSRFAIGDGAVVMGPATRALTPRTIRVQGDSIILNP
jgi:Rieske Fe-S protein